METGARARGLAGWARGRAMCERAMRNSNRLDRNLKLAYPAETTRHVFF
jgi:hypothetical protein